MSMYLMLAGLTFAIAGALIIHSFARHYKVSHVPFLMIFGMILGYMSRYGLLRLPETAFYPLAVIGLSAVIASLTSGINFLEINSTSRRSLIISAISATTVLILFSVIASKYSALMLTTIFALALIIASHSGNPEDKNSITRHEGLILAPILIVFALIFGSAAGDLLPDILRQFFIGTGVGLTLGLLGASIARRLHKVYWLILILMAAAAYMASSTIGGSGAMAAALCGYILGRIYNKEKRVSETRLNFAISFIGIFIFISAGYLAVPIRYPIIVLLAGLSYFASRWIAGRITLRGTPHKLKELILISFGASHGLLAISATLVLAYFNPAALIIIPIFLVTQVMSLFLDIAIGK